MINTHEHANHQRSRKWTLPSGRSLAEPRFCLRRPVKTRAHAIHEKREMVEWIVREIIESSYSEQHFGVCDERGKTV
jgi:hypothetical protein